MNFQTSITTCLTKYVTFSGRASRSEYWWFVLFNLIVGFVAAMLSTTLQAVVGLALFLPSLAVAIRRLHDSGRCGWWYLIIFIPLIGLFVLLYWLIIEGTKGANEYGPDSVSA
tara:strand:- start:1322 stop:1660 length:339 start_codon:yes stop_codon:yes gene_type:complete